ncbi:psd1-phosphatidylserine decarboxylase 1 [Malassezia pachydermatis]|uniref:Phosphatidylserine decarboxylase proenzyme 1, mitochondrial n=1 Tax=Malassezia pachydermatis TaxID=77020 RepID=A0A0M8MVD6_9BASI|nr:psd1-phosphatidylserine decarboxylase 1 [Malassezia pachydermatis]KOS14530.1 psd1-phosphatidylserine decarboxylase 1 [Malassezia pachydermatis]
MAGGWATPRVLYAMWLVTRPLAGRAPPTARLGLGAVRAYVRSPLEAEKEASTVRGQRAERARLQKLPRTTAEAGGPWARARRAWRETPLKWSPIPIALGAVVLVGVQAHREYNRHRRDAALVDEHGRPVRESGPWALYVLGALPLNAMSRAWGWANGLTLPVWFRPYGFKFYAWLFGCNLEEMREKDLTKYPSLGEFFTRELAPGARPVSDALLVSPADGKVLHFGTVEGDRVEQVKGLTYSLDSLLGNNAKAESMQIIPREAGDENVESEHAFAEVNGIAYSVPQLLGERTSRVRRVRDYVAGLARGSYRSLKQLVLWKRHAYDHVPTRQATDAEVAADELDAQEEGADEEHDVGIPTSDSAETLGHYASVAMDLRAEALPQLEASRHVAPGHRLYFCVIYLSPGDYHRFHSPVPWVVELRRHFRGELYSVSPYVAARLPNLFVINERVALLGRWRYGFFSMTPVGATNVGSILIHFDRNLRTNLRAERHLAGTFVEATYNAASRVLGGQPLAKGDEMGRFLLGSTIVLVFEAPETFQFTCHAGDQVHVGEALGDVL